MKYRATITIETDSLESAATVLIERLSHDEDYGFEYSILGWTPPVPEETQP